MSAEGGAAGIARPASLVELDRLTETDRQRVIAGETGLFGGGVGKA
jgi:hypothetical protein